MKYHVKRLTPEFKALVFSLLILKATLLVALYLRHISVSNFFYYLAVLFVTSLVVDHYQTEIVDESAVNLSKT